MASIVNMFHFMFMCPKSITVGERFYDNVTTVVHDVNLNVTVDEKITLKNY